MSHEGAEYRSLENLPQLYQRNKGEITLIQVSTWSNTLIFRQIDHPTNLSRVVSTQNKLQYYGYFEISELQILINQCKSVHIRIVCGHKLEVFSIY